MNGGNPGDFPLRWNFAGGERRIEKEASFSEMEDEQNLSILEEMQSGPEAVLSLKQAIA